MRWTCKWRLIVSWRSAGLWSPTIFRQMSVRCSSTTGGSGAFDAATGLGSVASKQTVTVDVTDGGQKQFDLYTFLHELSDNIALKVSALDASGNVLYEREFDVPMQQNYITWLSGAFFNGSGSSSTSVTSVTVNTDWAGETHLTF